MAFTSRANNERYPAASSFCRLNLKYENFTSSFGRLRQNIAPKSVQRVQHDYFSSFSQSNHWFLALSLRSPTFSLYLPTEWTGFGLRGREEERSWKRGWITSSVKNSSVIGTEPIAVIAVAPTGKASFVYSYVQMRLKGQYNGKWPFSLVYVLNRW